MNEALGVEKRNWSELASLLFLVLLVFWIVVNFSSYSTSENRQLWAASYQVIALLGGVLGISYSYLWGGHKSYIGRGILLLSIGLLLQCFGQSVYSYFIFYKQIDIPYPSLGDLGYFGSVIMYIGAATQFAKSSGVSLRSSYFKSKVGVFLLPLALLGVSYYVFLSGYVFDFASPLKTFLDFGYPLGEAIYVSIALITLIFCQGLLGGIMKKPITFLVFAFIVQYASDFMFLYQSNQGTWSAGGINDLMYAISYLLMALGIIYLGKTFRKIKSA